MCCLSLPCPSRFRAYAHSWPLLRAFKLQFQVASSNNESHGASSNVMASQEAGGGTGGEAGGKAGGAGERQGGVGSRHGGRVGYGETRRGDATGARADWMDAADTRAAVSPMHFATDEEREAYIRQIEAARKPRAPMSRLCKGIYASVVFMLFVVGPLWVAWAENEYQKAKPVGQERRWRRDWHTEPLTYSGGFLVNTL